MRIVLDLQGAQSKDPCQGLAGYALSLAQAIVRHPAEHEVILALSGLYPDTIEPIRGLFDGELEQERIRVWQTAGPVPFQDPANEWSRAATRRIRQAFIASLEPDLVHCSDPFGGYNEEVLGNNAIFGSRYTTTACVSHAPLDRLGSSSCPDKQYDNLDVDMVALAKRLDGWLAISDSTARDTRDMFELDTERVVTVPPAPAARFRRIAAGRDVEDQVCALYGVSGPFVMSSGGPDATKDLGTVVKAYATLPIGLRSGRQLVLVGPMVPRHADALRAMARAGGLGPEDIRITGAVGGDELVLLYNLCELFVLSSAEDDAGIAALEAMSCGAAVIGANARALPETLGWSEALFTPLDAAAVRAKIVHALTDPLFHSELTRRGWQHAAHFSWETSAEHAITAFERFLTFRAPIRPRPRIRTNVIVPSLVRQIRSLPGRPEDQALLRAARAIALNHPEEGVGRLFVDVSVLIRVDAGSGIQRVVRSILRSLPGALDGQHTLAPVYATPDRPGYRHAQRSESVTGPSTLTATDEVVEPHPGDTFLGLDLAQDVVVAQSQFYSELRRLGIPVYFVVYDLLPVLMPHRFTPDHEASHQQWLQVVGNADGALCISRAVAAELQEWVRANGPARHRRFRIEWFHLGADIERSDPSRGLPEGSPATLARLAARPTFLLVGTIEPRKGHIQALDSFDRLWGARTDVNLVFVGKKGWHMEEFATRMRRHREMGSRLLWLDDVSDEYLDEIYRASTCLIAPSEGEGFGLPLIEAARHGTPIIARDIPVFREIAGEHAFYFTGADSTSLAAAVHDWLTLLSNGRHPRSAGLNGRTWEQSATRVTQILFGHQAGGKGETVQSRSRDPELANA